MIRGRAKREKATKTSRNKKNNGNIIDINAMDEPTYEDREQMGQDDENDEKE